MLAEANRLAPQCPLVSWQLGAALLAAGGDALLAVRALQKALGLDGLAKYLGQPNRLWAESLPGDSWVRNLALRAAAQRTAFRCPLGLDRIDVVLQSARLSLAEALEACGRAGEAVPIFNDLLKSGDTLAGIAAKTGTTVARLEQLNPGIDPTALRVGQTIRVQ